MLECLIMGGAFDCFGLSRATLLANYEEIWEREASNRNLLDSGQMFFDFMIEDNYKYRIVDSVKKEMLISEKAVLGRYISGHPLDGHAKEFEGFSFNTDMLKPIETDDANINDNFTDEDSVNETEKEVKYQVAHGQEVFFGGLISEIKLKISAKTGKQWGFANIEDMLGSLEILFYSRILERKKAMFINDKLVRIKGRIKLELGRNPQIEVIDILPFELDEIDEIIDNRTMYVNIINDEAFENTYALLSSYKGGSVIVKVQRDSKLYTLNFKIANADMVKNKLVGLVGYANIKLF